MADVTNILNSIEKGDPNAANELLLIVYEELRQLAAAKLAKEKPGQTLQATALVNEAYLRLVEKNDTTWNGRGHFFGAAALAMRRILIDRARRKGSLKAGGEFNQVGLSGVEPVAASKSIDLIALDEALDEFERIDPRACKVVQLRYFTGLNISETSQALEVSETTVENDWAYAKSWLKRRLCND